MNTAIQQPTQYEIRFQSLYNEGRALTFPCDAQGHVEMDALSEKARLNYLYARAVVGRELLPRPCEKPNCIDPAAGT